MRSLPALYAQQFKTSLAVMLQYRASLLIWLISHLLEPLVYLVVWSAVSAAQGGSVGGYDAHGFAAYFIVLMLVNHVTYTWIMWEYEYRVRHGSLSFALLRPVHPIHADLADNLSSKIITLPLILVAAAVLTVIFRPSLQTPLWAAAAFVPAVLLALAVRFLMEWTLALAAFWTTRVSALNRVYFVALLFLSGQMAPLSLLPAPIRLVATILPFRWTTSFPVELLLGKLGVRETLLGLAAQVAWIIVGVVVLRVVWRAGVRVFTAVGA